MGAVSAAGAAGEAPALQAASAKQGDSTMNAPASPPAGSAGAATGAVHALAYPLGGAYHVAHGVSNSLLTPHVFRFNLPSAPGQYADIARALKITPHEVQEIAAAIGELDPRPGLSSEGEIHPQRLSVWPGRIWRTIAIMVLTWHCSIITLV